RLGHNGTVPDLWESLAPVARKGKGRDDGRLVIDDSKVVYSGARGLARLERGVLVPLALDPVPANLANLVAHLAPHDGDDLATEAWYTGASTVPLPPPPETTSLTDRFHTTCAAGSLGPWRAWCVVVCPPRFNRICTAADSKAGVPAFAMARLLME